MKARMFIFFVVSAFALLLVSCGDETSSSTQQPQFRGTVLNQNSIRKADTLAKVPVLKKIQLPPANIQTWPMVSTGQTKCYDNKHEIECPEPGDGYFGQDGQMQYGTRSLTSENSDEIVRDSVTQLLWTKQIRTNMTWYEAKAYCDSVRLSNKTWRLPTTAELRSIVNYGKVGPAIEDVFYKQGVVEDTELKESLSNWFWASKHVYLDSENGTDLASSWIINFYDGFVEYTSRYNTYNVRCVTAEF